MDKLNTLLKAQSELSALISDVKTDVCKALKEKFLAAGGCDRCGGRGWVVTWDTLDSMSGCYAEYGNCPNADCTEHTRKASGLDMSYHSKYDGNQGIRDRREESPEYKLLVAPLLDQQASLANEINTIQAQLKVAKGKTVEVVKGRKVPKGTRGEVIWIGANQWGERVGVKDSAGTVHWTALDNVAVVLEMRA